MTAFLDGADVMTISCHLGALGFFAHPALTAEGGGTSGNYGMLDQQAAMKWVRANVDLASPLAAGLFDKAMSFSGVVWAWHSPVPGPGRPT